VGLFSATEPRTAKKTELEGKKKSSQGRDLARGAILNASEGRKNPSWRDPEPRQGGEKGNGRIIEKALSYNEKTRILLGGAEAA